MMTSLARVAAVLAMTSSLVACIIEDGPPRRLTPEPQPSSSGGTGAGTVGGSSGAVGGSSGSSGTSSPSAPSPMLVEIDTDQVMTADPGQGVGVFTEYAKGGKWHVWWTCDTAKTNQDCDFAVNVTAASGNITDVDAAELQGGFSSTPTPSRVEARTKTASQLHGIKFSTNPGAVITLEASVGGVKDGAFLFFVQDGKVNGGFTGKVTNPLQLQGSTP